MDTTSANTFKKYPVLVAGEKHSLVPSVKAMLRSQGAWTGTDSEDFGPNLKAAVQYFQNTHLGPDGKYLASNGEVGPGTWWALYNPSGDAQKSNLTPVAPVNNRGNLAAEFKRRYGKLSPARQNFLKEVWTQYLLPVKEIPDGSNGGPEVDKYTTGIGRLPWCAMFLSWCFKTANGEWPHKQRRAGVLDWWRAASSGGYGYKVNSGYKPKPGDLMAFLFAGGKGHITCIVACDDNLAKFNTVGGNESNRVKLGLRTPSKEPTLAGYISLFNDEGDDIDFVKELLDAQDESSLDSAGTR